MARFRVGYQIHPQHCTIDQIRDAYRNPDSLGVDVRAGWFERDYDEYVAEFGDAPARLRKLGTALPRIKERLGKLDAAHGDGRIPIMIGGAGEKVTFKLTAQYADLWNTFPPVASWKHKSEVLDEWCAKVGRDPKAIERTCSVNAENLGVVDELLAAGAQQLIVRGAQPFDMKPVEELLKLSGK